MVLAAQPCKARRARTRLRAGRCVAVSMSEALSLNAEEGTMAVSKWVLGHDGLVNCVRTAQYKWK